MEKVEINPNYFVILMKNENKRKFLNVPYRKSMYTLCFMSIEVSKKIFPAFDNVFHVYLSPDEWIPKICKKKKKNHDDFFQNLLYPHGQAG